MAPRPPAPFGPDHKALVDLLALVTKREGELREAGFRLLDWLRRNRPTKTLNYDP